MAWMENLFLKGNTDKFLAELFVYWKFGNISKKEIELELLDLSISNKFWKRELFSQIKKEFEKANIRIPGQNEQPKELKFYSWQDFVSPQCQACLQHGEYLEAWNIHLAEEAETGSWNYCAARIALENWLASGKEVEWLEQTHDFLIECQTDPIWKNEVKILLSEIKKRL